MNNELKEKLNSEVEEFKKGQSALKEREEALTQLNQEITGITNFLIQKRGRIEMLSELIGPEEGEEKPTVEETKED